jgi:signal transduction histidine kinase
MLLNERFKVLIVDDERRNLVILTELLRDNHEVMVAKSGEQALGTLTVGVAHEINNPVNFAHVSAGNLTADVTDLKDFIFDLAGDSLDQEVRDEFDSKFNQLFFHINTIKEGTCRIKDLVDDLWSITLHDNPDKTDIDVAQILQSAIALTKTRFAIVTAFSTRFDELPTFYGYPGKLNQVFNNVLLNACEG